jgi:hypothetical protein
MTTIGNSMICAEKGGKGCLEIYSDGGDVGA